MNDKCMAFMGKSLSDTDTDEDQDNEMSDQERDYKELYHEAHANLVKVSKYGYKISIKFQAAQNENSTLKIELEQALEKVRLLESQKNCLAENLTTDGLKLQKAERDVADLKNEIVKMKAENEDLQGRLKITLPELQVKQASLNKMNTGSKTLTNILCGQKSQFDRSGPVIIMVHPLQMLKVK